MKYIAGAIAFAIVILALWFVLITPPCDGDYDIGLGGEKHFLFSCKNTSKSGAENVPESGNSIPIEDARVSTTEVPQASELSAENTPEKCVGDIQTVLSNNIAEVNRWISIQDELRLHVLALSSTEADLAVRTNIGDDIETFTIRAGRTKVFRVEQFEYRLLLNSIDDPTFNDLRVNVTMHKITCT